MGWIEQVSADPHRHGGCQKPDSRSGVAFGPGSRWQCDTCGRIWRFTRHVSDQRDSYDQWASEPAVPAAPAPT